MRIAFIADIHEDYPRLLLTLERIRQFSCDGIICLGDITGFTIPHCRYHHERNASACLQLVKEHCTTAVAGNHDQHAAGVVPAISPLFEWPENWYQLDDHEQYQMSDNKVWLHRRDELDPLLAREERAFLAQIPEFDVLRFNGTQALLTHYLYPNITGAATVFYETAEEASPHRKFMEEKGCSLSFTGHRHFPGLLVFRHSRVISKPYGRKLRCIPGDVVNCPPVARGYTPPGFCIFDTEHAVITAYKL